jgi:hypothetical protein
MPKSYIETTGGQHIRSRALHAQWALQLRKTLSLLMDLSCEGCGSMRKGGWTRYARPYILFPQQNRQNHTSKQWAVSIFSSTKSPKSYIETMGSQHIFLNKIAKIID